MGEEGRLEHQFGQRRAQEQRFRAEKPRQVPSLPPSPTLSSPHIPPPHPHWWEGRICRSLAFQWAKGLEQKEEGCGLGGLEREGHPSVQHHRAYITARGGGSSPRQCPELNPIIFFSGRGSRVWEAREGMSFHSAGGRRVLALHGDKASDPLPQPTGGRAWL